MLFHIPPSLLVLLFGAALLPGATFAADLTKVNVSVNDKQCDPMTLTVPAGKTQFTIKNNSMRALEWEILKGVLVVEERENIAPGFIQKMTVDLQPGEYEEIEQEHSRLANGGQIVSDCQACLDLLYDNDEATVASLLKNSLSRLEDLCVLDDRLQSVTSMLQEAMIQVQESQQELRSYLDQLELDPERFKQLHFNASLWFTNHHMPTLAIEHACLAEDPEMLAALVDALRPEKADDLAAAARLIGTDGLNSSVSAGILPVLEG